MDFVDIAARNEAGTLLCICGKTGVFFAHADNKIVDGKTYGILRGLCSDACRDTWKSRETVQVSTPRVLEQAKMFG